MPRRRKSDFRDNLIGLAVVAGIVIAVKYPVWAITLATVAFVAWIGILLIPRERKLRTYDMAMVDQMNGSEFENYIGELFRCLGFDAEVTKATGDYGVDVICEKGNERIAIQAKRHSQRVNLKAVQEVVAGMRKYQCNKSMVITSNYFSQSAIELASNNNCELVDRDQLAYLIQKAALLRAKSAASHANSTDLAVKKSDRTVVACAHCGQKLRLPRGAEGKVICPACCIGFWVKT